MDCEVGNVGLNRLNKKSFYIRCNHFECIKSIFEPFRGYLFMDYILVIGKGYVYNQKGHRLANGSPLGMSM